MGILLLPRAGKVEEGEEEEEEEGGRGEEVQWRGGGGKGSIFVYCLLLFSCVWVLLL